MAQQLGPGRLRSQASKLIDNGQLTEAQGLLESHVQQERSAGVFELLAEIALRQGRFDDATQLFKELQERHGPSARIIARIGDVFDTSGQSAQAREYWMKAAQLQAGVDLKAIHHKLADSLTKQGEAEAAERHRALGHYYVGRELLQYGHAPQAINYFQGAVDLDPTLVQGWFYLGESHRMTGHSEESQAAYRKCLELNPFHGRALASMSAD